MAARAAAQVLEEEKDKLKKKKPELAHEDVHARFAELMRKPFAREVPEAEIKRYEDIALAKRAHAPGWRDFLRTVLTAEAAPAGERMSMDDLIKLALQRPVPVKKAQEDTRIREMVAVKSPGFDYKPSAVTAAVDLGILLETKKRVNLRREWVGEEAVA